MREFCIFTEDSVKFNIQTFCRMFGLGLDWDDDIGMTDDTHVHTIDSMNIDEGSRGKGDCSCLRINSSIG